MRVLVFEDDHTGHRLGYARRIAMAAAELGCEVAVAVGKEAPASAEYAAHLKPIERDVQIHPILELKRVPPYELAAHRAAMLADAAKKLHPQHIFIPTADGLAQCLGASRSRRRFFEGTQIEIEGVLHRGQFAHRNIGFGRRVRAVLSRMTLGRSEMVRLHFVDCVAYEFLKARRGHLSDIARLLPDPVTAVPEISRADARARLGIPVDGVYVGCVGLLDSRKGIDLLLRAFADAKLADDHRLLLAGRLSEDLRPLVDSLEPLVRAGRIILVDRYISDEELQTHIAAMDLLAAVYPSHLELASVALRAAGMRRAILASNVGWLGQTIPRFGLGWTVRPNDVRALAAALAPRMREAIHYQQPEIAQRLLAFHDPDNFAASITVRLRERLKLPPAPRITWEEVNAAS